jgi:hypothetical protein
MRGRGGDGEQEISEALIQNPKSTSKELSLLVSND